MTALEYKAGCYFLLPDAPTNDLQATVMAESNLQDVATIVVQIHRNRKPLLKNRGTII